MKHLYRLAASAALVALMGAGCGSAPAPSGSTPSASNPGNVVAQGGSGCLNDYYPLKNGSSITYKMTGGAEIPMTVTVSEATSNSAKLTYSFTVRGKEVKVSTTISCDANGVRANGYLDFASALNGLDMSFETKSMEGQILPADLAVGTEWDQKTVVTMHTGDARLKSMIDGKDETVETHNKVLGEESVTVPAGTFTARKVQQDIKVSNSLLPNGITTRTISWFVKGVGLVKSQSTTANTTSGMEATAISH